MSVPWAPGLTPPATPAMANRDHDTGWSALPGRRQDRHPRSGRQRPDRHLRTRHHHRRQPRRRGTRRLHGRRPAPALHRGADRQGQDEPRLRHHRAPIPRRHRRHRRHRPPPRGRRWPGARLRLYEPSTPPLHCLGRRRRRRPGRRRPQAGLATREPAAVGDRLRDPIHRAATGRARPERRSRRPRRPTPSPPPSRTRRTGRVHPCRPCRGAASEPHRGRRAAPGARRSRYWRRRVGGYRGRCSRPTDQDHRTSATRGCLAIQRLVCQPR